MIEDPDICLAARSMGLRVADTTRVGFHRGTTAKVSVVGWSRTTIGMDTGMESTFDRRQHDHRLVPPVIGINATQQSSTVRGTPLVLSPNNSSPDPRGIVDQSQGRMCRMTYGILVIDSRDSATLSVHIERRATNPHLGFRLRLSCGGEAVLVEYGTLEPGRSLPRRRTCPA